jgi:transcriptional regulator with XRE-family HTH domain
MRPRELNVRGGKRLRALRRSLGLSIREVERLSQKVVDEKKNRDFYLSDTWVTDIEKGNFRPSAFKIYSLSVIYKCGFGKILSFFGLKLSDIVRDQALFGLPKTHLVGAAEEDAAESMTLPVGPHSGFDLEKTALLNRLVEAWGDFPVPLLERLDLRKSLYGYIGLKDFTLSPLLPPGSFVQIDTSQTKIKKGSWRLEFERPIYFIELRDGYVCGWCEIKDGQLSVIPHPNSPVEIRRFPYPGEAVIVGRVTGVAMRIVEGNFILPKRSADPSQRVPPEK